MYISSIKIKDFRAFSEPEQLELGKYMTCISGHNGIGKTTILAILSNVGELKSNCGRHLNGDMFRGEYSKLIKGDDRFDTKGNGKVEISFLGHDEEEEINEQTVMFRATFQKHDINQKEYKPLPDNPKLFRQINKTTTIIRYRLIPQKNKFRDNEKKISWPTYYLGLSRLYPIGESAEVKSKKLVIGEETQKRIAEQYRSILSMSDEVRSASIVSLGDAKNKKGAGIVTDKYGDVGISSGQDNLGQIILTIESFRNLKNEMESEYKGGIFLIDELDAALHPSAQIKLYNYLYSQAKELNLQIVFTTHSITLVEHVYRVGQLRALNPATRLIYLQNGRGRMEIHDNPDIQLVKNDLRNQMNYHLMKRIEIPILLEDEVARRFLKHILQKKSEANFSLLYNEASISASEICKLLAAYPEFFRNFLVVLDPDMSVGREMSNIENLLLKTDFALYRDDAGYNSRRKLLTLPGDQAIEKMLWDYFKNIPEEDRFYFLPECEAYNIRKRTLIYQALDVFCTNGEENIGFCKKWFTHQSPVIQDALLNEWITVNDDIVSIFVDNFINEYNFVAKQVGAALVSNA